MGRACPAAVYEYADAEGGEADAQGKKFVINSQVRHLDVVSGPSSINADEQNCIHVGLFHLGPKVVGERGADDIVQDMFYQDTNSGYLVGWYVLFLYRSFLHLFGR